MVRQETIEFPKTGDFPVDMQIRGFHHITAITSDATEAIRFYTRVLGLYLVKKTVNFDDPSAYHLYFGDPTGTPGTILTFFDWGPSVNHGSVGAGVVHHLAFTTRNDDTLLRWKAHLDQSQVPVEGPYDLKSGRSIYLLDPDGLIIEITTPQTLGYSDDENSELAVFSQRKTFSHQQDAIAAIDKEMRLLGLHHATAIANTPSKSNVFYSDILSGNLVKTKPVDSAGWQRQLGQTPKSQNFLNFTEVPSATPGLVGVGTVHHIAFAVDDEEGQIEWRNRLLSRGVRVTAVLDRKYFKSIYFREPNGILLEIATIPPGFAVDEPLGHLGRSLTLPDWLEARRAIIEAALKPVGPVN